MFVFHVSVPTTRDCFVHFTFIVLYVVVFSLCIKINIMDTYHAADWSSDCSRYSSSEEEDEVRYTQGFFAAGGTGALHKIDGVMRKKILWIY